MTLPDATRCSRCCPLIALRKSLLKRFWPELQIRFTQLEREGSPPPGLRLPQAKLSRNSNQVARGRIRRFESYMPSQAVRSPPMASASSPSFTGTLLELWAEVGDGIRR